MTSAPREETQNAAVHQNARAAFSRSGLCQLLTLTERRDFLAAARARFVHMPGFVLQARQRRPDEPVVACTNAQVIRVGYTCSKKIGNAVKRNRAKRRLREIARTVIGAHGTAGWDYVLIGRAEKTIASDYASLLVDLRSALESVHTQKARAPRRS